MNDELVKALRNCDRANNGGQGSCYGCRYSNEASCKWKMMRDAAEAIEELVQIANHHEQSAKDWWKEASDWKQQAATLSAEVERLKADLNAAYEH